METEMSRGLFAGPPPGLDMLLEQEPNPNPVPYPLHPNQAALHEPGCNSSQLERVQHPMLPAEQPSSSRLAAATPQPAPLVVPSTNDEHFGQTTGPGSPTQQDGESTFDDWFGETQRNSVQDPQFWDRVTAADKELPSELPGSSSIQQEGAQKIAVPRDSRHSQQADAHGTAVAAQQSRGSKRQASPDEAVSAPELKRNAGQVVSEQPLPAVDASPDAHQGPDDFAGHRQSVLSHLESTRRRLLSVGSDDGDSYDESAQGQGDAHAQAPQRLHLSTDTTDPILGSPWVPQPSRNEEFDSLLRLRAYQQGSSSDDPGPLCDSMLDTVAMTST